MSESDIRNKTEELKGKAKETVGDVTDDERLEAEGKTDQAKANIKQAGEDVKDSAREAGDAVRDDLN